MNNRKPIPTISDPKTVCFRLTRKCNYSCDFCQAPYNKNELTFQDATRIIDSLIFHGTQEIKFTGGEPLSSPFFREIVLYAYENDLKITIMTNGTLIDDTLIQLFIDCKCRLKISLHGLRHIHDAYKGSTPYTTVLGSIERCITKNIDVSVHTIVTRAHPLDVDSWVSEMRNIGVRKISFLPFVARGRGKSVGDIYLLGQNEIRLLKKSINLCSRKYTGTIVVRYVDLLSKDYLFVESSGNLVIERSLETLDDIVFPL